jgi:hypothetical protein
MIGVLQHARQDTKTSLEGGNYPDRTVLELNMEALTANCDDIDVGVRADIRKGHLIAALSPVHDYVCFGGGIESGGGG